jgi:SAM-dependent methyltransferase
LDDAWGDEKFDLIFTVSVLIHNPPEQARELLIAMRRHLAEGGQIVLIENKVSAVSRKSNLWHAGCWVHDVAKDLAPDMCLVVRDTVLDGQSIYILQEPTGEVPPARFVGCGWRGQLADFQASQNNETAQPAKGDSITQDMPLEHLIGRMHDLEETVSELKFAAARYADVDANTLGELEALNILTKAVENR